MATSLLIVDDETKMCTVLARMLARDGYDVQWCDNPADAMEMLARLSFDIVLCDLRMPGFSGIDVLERAKAGNSSVDVVMMTAYATPQTAVESMKKGAIDYLIKPFAIEDLRALIKRIELTRSGTEDLLDHEEAGAGSALQPGGMEPAAGVRARSVPPPESVVSAVDPQDSDIVGLAQQLGLIAVSSQMRQVLLRIRKVAGSDASVLLRGESGTGKEVIARSLHRLSRRAAAQMVSVNCGAIPESLMESELFGHIKGSFTGAIENRTGLFEAADGGTIFLDEIGELPLYLQVKLLRVLQEGEIQRVGESQQRRVNVRVIAATNRDLEADVGLGKFRKDLYYRLNVIPVILPPLRERRSDIEPLIRHFLQKFAGADRPALRMSASAFRLLMEYDYPGNIRELENAIEHAVVLSAGDEILPDDLPLQVQESGFGTAGGARIRDAAEGELDEAGLPSRAASATSHLEQAEIALIMQALEKTGYNFTRAAQHLGITRRTLGYRINKYGLYDEIIQQKSRQGRLERDS